jgi:flagellin-specific chaperone FliS
MANRLGYREEAQRFREEIEQSHRDAVESKVNMAIQQVEELFASCQWERARAEVRRLLSLYPAHPRVQVLPDRLEVSFTDRKELLKRQFREAAERKEVDRSIELVKELDAYLSPDEANELTETVREIFRDKLDNLTVQFELAVHEHRWMRAVDIAKQIMSEYPNTRRAQELRDGVFESLLKRAGLKRGDQIESR